VNRKFIALIIIIIFVFAFFLAKDLILKTIFEKTVTALSGLQITASCIDVAIFKPSIRVKGMVILNPAASFPNDKIMAQINELYVHYDISSYFRKEIRIKDMIFDVGLVNVVRNKNRENNLNSLKVVKALETVNKNEKVKNGLPGIMIEKLHLKGGMVKYKDYTKAPYPAIKEFEVDVDEHYENITNPYQLVSLLVSRSLVKTGPSNMIGFDLAPIQQQVNEAVSAIRDTTEQVKKALKISY
jgi:hypothetical protein